MTNDPEYEAETVALFTEAARYGDVPGLIERLHREAEDLAASAKFSKSSEVAAFLLRAATRKVRQAAALREAYGVDE